jgi:hypothetical protein
VKSDEFIREVDEELQRDRLSTLWHRYGRLVIAGAVLLVVGVAAYEGWQAWRASQMQAEALRFADAQSELDQQHWKEGAAALQSFAGTAEGGYATLARFREADALQQAGDRAGAAAALDAVAGEADADPLLRDLAALLSAQLQLDTASVEDLRSRLVPLAEAGRPWRNSARELLALVAIRAGDHQQAQETLSALASDAEATPAQKQRAEVLKESIAVSGS